MEERRETTMTKKKFTVKGTTVIADGAHEGRIVGIEYKDKPFEYADVLIKTQGDNGEITLKVGFPQFISPESKFGELLQKFLGKELEIDQEIVPEDILVGKECFFQTITKSTTSGDFARVVRESLKPLKKAFPGVKTADE